jgi:hypothetical protein
MHEPGAAFRARYEKLAAEPPPALRAELADARVLHLPGNVPPWTDSGMEVARGDALTFLAEGRVVTSEALGLHGGPRYHLWGRIGERGTIWNGPRDTHSRVAESSGRLFLAIYQGEWATREGALATPVEAYAEVSGGLDVLALRWRGDAAAGLRALAEAAPADPLVAREVARLAAPVPPPAGWRYLWFLGESECFRAATADGRPTIAASCADDVAILQRPVDFALDGETRVSWRWRLPGLASREREDALLAHDYLSIALEFENGRDLTWFWSAALPVGAHFACPIPTWTAREAHFVVRSGAQGLGAWLAESRGVRADYAAAIGEPIPRRVVAVWLIAVSLFAHGTARGEFAGIELTRGGERLRVL